MIGEVFIGGRRLSLGRRIGKGGEGEVYLLEGDSKMAVKIYTTASHGDREAKVRAMIGNGLARTCSFVAFPTEAVFKADGSFAGFSMPLVNGAREIHQLYGPKSRKAHFPKASFRFLVRAAANAARAVGQVHATDCVIGDLNESGFLVSPDATVALIDADSFHYSAGGRVFPCLVGKPPFTPPELQGKSFAGINRLRSHDHFGLAVLVFHLLFMGKHPYAGIISGGRDAADQSLEGMIKANLFAYSRGWQTGVSPPSGSPSLDDFPGQIGDAFERAFGLDPAKRPSAAEWVSCLDGLEGRLKRCADNGMHYFPSAASQCPWCRMEGNSGLVLFLAPESQKSAEASSAAAFDVERAWAAITSITLPDLVTITPLISSPTARPSRRAKAAKIGGYKYKAFGLFVGAAACIAWANFPAIGIVWFGMLIFAVIQMARPGVDKSSWQREWTLIEDRWDESLNAWREAGGVPLVGRLRLELERAVSEFRGLAAGKAQALANLAIDRQSRQLGDYLDQFLIRDASISGIGKAKAFTLASFGIETAADVVRGRILAVPGFGSVTADKIVAWRLRLERGFVYNPAHNQGDAAAQAKIESDFAARSTSLARKISGGQVELTRHASVLQKRASEHDPQLDRIALERAQIEADLDFLDLGRPIRSAPRVSPSFTTAGTTGSHANAAAGASSAATSCPRCGSSMVRRTARRGSNRGNRFWGCSRYPICSGTRP